MNRHSGPVSVLTPLRLARELNVSANGCTMIGDSIHDIAMGSAAGMRTVGVTWGVNAATELHSAMASVVVEDVESLIDALTNHMPSSN